MEGGDVGRDSHGGGARKRNLTPGGTETQEPCSQLKLQPHPRGCPPPSPTPGSVSLGPARWQWGKCYWEGRSHQAKRQSRHVQLLHVASGPPGVLVSRIFRGHFLAPPSERPPLLSSSHERHQPGSPAHLQQWDPHYLPLLSCLDFGLSELIQSLDIKYNPEAPEVTSAAFDLSNEPQLPAPSFY